MCSSERALVVIYLMTVKYHSYFLLSHMLQLFFHTNYEAYGD